MESLLKGLVSFIPDPGYSTGKRCCLFSTCHSKSHSRPLTTSLRGPPPCSCLLCLHHSTAQSSAENNHARQL